MYSFINNLGSKSTKIIQLGDFLKKNHLARTQIFLSSMDNFLIAFFGSLYANTQPLLLRDECFEENIYFINDKNFDYILNTINKYEVSLSNELTFTGNEIFYLKTSGSTGCPKMIEKTLNDMLLEAKHLSYVFNIDKDNDFLTSITHQNMFGLTFKVFLPLVLGVEVLSDELKYPEIILEQHLENKVLVSSPTVLNALYQNINSHKIKSLKMIISSGARLSENIRLGLKQFTDADIIDIYGSSETGIIGFNIGNGIRKFSSVNVEVADNSALIITSPWCKRFVSNDSGEVVGDFIHLQGRLDRIVKICENRVNLDAIEDKLRKNELISDCKLGIHPKFNRVLALLVLSEKGENLFINSGKKGVVTYIKKYLNDDFGSIVRYFKVVSQIPYSSFSKVTRSDFLSEFEKYQMPTFNQISSNTFEADIKVSDFYFDGHFSNFPIVPGFIQIKFVQICAEIIGINLSEMKHVESIKFTNFIRPNDKIQIILKQEYNKLGFKIMNDKDCCNGKISI